MKVKKSSAEVETQGDLRYIDLDLLVDNKEIKNRDIDKEHVAFLKDAIGRDGLNVPLIAWDGGNPTNTMRVAINGVKQHVAASFLLAGYHRREALRQLRKEDSAKFKKLFPEGIPVKIKHGSLEDALISQLSENLARLNPTAADVLPFIRRLLDAGLKKGQIAKRIGKSPAYISEVLSIEDTLGEEAGDDLESGDIDIAEGLKATKKVKKGKLTKEEARAEAKAKTKKKKDKGHVRAEKRKSLKALYAAFNALPNMNIGKRLEILTEICDYCIGETDDLPDALDLEDDEKPAKKKKKK